ncbi:unnamed protein product [Pocillopora meandrina]|uniref:Uncharacterized protein n=1 Tax=Pocillopora meandrina TaxID=46732 RepID=A0AAU9XQK4_9CNID|nr:unnamed protein product [Pocillopora meandrina]
MANKVPVGKTIYSTYGESILTSTETTEMTLLAPCTHETADTHFNAADAASSRHRRIRIRYNITDIVVLAISVASTLPTDELWITQGSGKNLQNIPALAIEMSLVFPQMTPVVKDLKASPQEITGGGMVVLERFVVLLYDLTSSLKKVNETPQKLFI